MAYKTENMKKLFPLFLIIAVVAMSSCASLYTAMYAPPEIKAVDGELVRAVNVKAYEVLTPKVGDAKTGNSKFNVTDQEETSGSLIQYKTPDGEYHWYINRDYGEAENSLFIPEKMILDQYNSTSEDYSGKCQDMTPTAYNYYCVNPETDEKYKIRQFPWSKGYGYFYALVSDKGTIIYSLSVSDLNFY